MLWHCWLVSWPVVVQIRLTEATDTMYSFYLQRNIYTTENSLEHVVPVASLHRHVRLHACSTVCLSQADSVPLLYESRRPTWRLTHCPSLHVDCHVYHDCQSPSTTSASDPVSTVADRRVESFNALTVTVGQQERHLACKKLGVGLLMVMIWLELCMSCSSSCYHHLHHP